jgi:hypothetical protein
MPVMDKFDHTITVWTHPGGLILGKRPAEHNRLASRPPADPRTHAKNIRAPEIDVHNHPVPHDETLLDGNVKHGYPLAFLG